MTEEMKLVPVETKYKNKEGEVIYNIALKTRVMPDGSVMQGLMDGKHIVFEKIFPKGFENKKADYSTFSINVRYDGKLCSFMLYDKDHAKFEEAGGSGDLVKASAKSYEYDKKQADGTTKKTKAMELIFDKVE